MISFIAKGSTLYVNIHLMDSEGNEVNFQLECSTIKNQNAQALAILLNDRLTNSITMGHVAAYHQGYKDCKDKRKKKPDGEQDCCITQMINPFIDIPEGKK